MSESLRLGNTTITVANDDFANAFQIGYLRYKLDYRTTSLTDIEVYAFYVGTITSVLNPGCFNAGYLTGWVAALLEHKEQPSTPLPVSVPPPAHPTTEVHA